jgi:hypothetical protein
MPRDRKGYDPHGLSIRRLIAEDWFVGKSAQRMSAIGAMTIDGRPLLDQPYWMRSNSVHEVRSAPKMSEPAKLTVSAGPDYRGNIISETLPLRATSQGAPPQEPR